ncbi:MAG TPA: xanthine dehydrogenase family protein molybdopterin-binding subunit [Acetobacteraceae bacterium]|nr:xanthine dehydrogenase family protein molybdopterin-binding subunit [Acetobacteraceae bacterium]
MLHNPTGTGIGQPVRRREDLRLLTGRGRYSDDINVPGQAHAVMVRSTHAHAVIRSIDTAMAATAPGVLAVLTGRDMLADGLKPIPHAVRTGHPADIALDNSDGSPPFIPPHYPMATDEARHVGDIVAMVVATSRAAAKDAAERVIVNYADLAAVVFSRTAIAPNAPLTWSDASSNFCLDAQIGDAAATDAAFASAAHVVRLSTRVQRIAGVTMEPRAATGEYDATTNSYTLHAGAGGAVRPRHDMAIVLGVPDDNVRMVMHDVGGNFGTRGASNPEFALVAWAAKRVHQAVKWTCERSEAFLCDYQARDLTADAELALDAGGKFLAMRGTNMVDSGAYPVSFGPLHKGVEIMSSIYHVPTVHFRACATLTNTAPTRPYRSSGRPEAMFVVERLIDIAARQCGFDRVELRRHNLVPESAMPYRNPFGLEYDSGAYHKVMETVLALGDWRGFASRRDEARARGKLRGIGIANYVDTATGVPRERAEITVLPSGAVELVIGTVSSGQGHETSFAQLVGDWLGVPMESVVLVQGDTARVSVGGGSHSGRALRLGSIVMLGATNEIIAKGLRIAGHILEAAVADMEFSSGRFIVKGTDRSIGIFELAAVAARRDDLPDDLRKLDGIGDETINRAAFPYGCHVCEVEIDPETGVVGVVNYSAVDDVGRAVNPMIVHGQVHGGIAHGIGQALLEQVWYDPDSGQLLSGSLMDYAIAHADNVPFYQTELSEVPSPTHPLGIRPAGEGGTTPALAAVTNAIVDALSDYGVTHIEMPATPERIWRAMQGSAT